MIHYLFRYVLPAAYVLLPAPMTSPAASAMLLTIAVQESRCQHRRQIRGPARGFYQFERNGGVKGVLMHHATANAIAAAMDALQYKATVPVAYTAIEHNDILATCFARCLLWTLPDSLPSVEEPYRGWDQYIRAWRPGKPHPETWNEFYAQAWTVVTDGVVD